MENTKVLAAAHSYSTRARKGTQHEELIEHVERKITPLRKVNKMEPLTSAPTANNSSKFCIVSGYASPPCRPIVPLSQNNENEIEWDLTSPSALKYQRLTSDKKTSTPNRTPTRVSAKREVRPRMALCKKNIALRVSEEASADLVNELAALNDLVNLEQGKTAIMTPPHSVKGATDCESSHQKPNTPKPYNVNTSDVFDDDSFFSESVLLSTQAVEQEAVRPAIRQQKTAVLGSVHTPSPSAYSSPESNTTRKSFDLDSDDLDEPIRPLRLANKPQSPPVVRRHQALVKSKICTITSAVVGSDRPPGNSNCPSPNSVQSKKAGTPYPVNPVGNQNNFRPDKPPAPLFCDNNIGIKRLPDEPVTARPAIPRAAQPAVNAGSCLFDDDDDDDLLCAVADQIERQFESQCNKPVARDEDDDLFFQPDVLEFISQIETQAISTQQKSTAELMEEKRQAAIRKRQERMMNAKR